MAKPKEINYYKPIMGTLRGRIGASIVETILNAQKPDLSNLKREADEYLMARMAEKKT